MVLLIDNYDSFTYNLVQYLEELKQKVIVFRNDKISISKVKKLAPAHIVISPGPKTPADAGISMKLIKTFAGKIPILGVCLGHQCIGAVYGRRIIMAKKLVHGKTSIIYHDGKTIFKNLQNPFIATRYHSLVVEGRSVPDELVISAWTKDGEVMGLRHKNLKMEGVQFHPEAILTYYGKRLLDNFLHL